LTFADVEQAKSAKNLIITCEELVDESYLKNDPDRNQIPFLHASVVIHIPHGAYPCACYGYYDYDPIFLKEYAKAARDDRQYHKYIQESILNHSTHSDFLDYVGKDRLKLIAADKDYGYAKDLVR
jgi:glutaconate CoA-transferase subunit A